MEKPIEEMTKEIQLCFYANDELCGSQDKPCLKIATHGFDFGDGNEIPVCKNCFEELKKGV